jgi:hypothetical protein
VCLIVKSDTTIQIAKKDIPCIKVVRHEPYLLGLIKYWKSPMYNKDIKRKYNRILHDVEHLKLDIECGFRSADFVINQGYHTFIDEESIKQLFSFKENLDFYKICKSVIPKGAEYCVGEWGTLVSNKLIVFSSKRKFEFWMKKKNK